MYVFKETRDCDHLQGLIESLRLENTPTNSLHCIKVVLAARRENMLEAVADEIRAAGGEAVVVASDASKAKYSSWALK